MPDDNRNFAVSRHILMGTALISLFMSTMAYATETQYSRNPESDLESWEILDHGIRFSLTQMLPDQARAFFMGRGFERAAAEVYAQACVFQAVARNEGGKTIALRLADWRALAGKEPLSPRLDTDWQREWKKLGVAQPARIAFRWAQFPSEQIFEPGDWNQGMVAFALPRGARFDLGLKWQANGQTFETLIKGARCAEDR